MLWFINLARRGLTWVYTHVTIKMQRRHGLANQSNEQREVMVIIASHRMASFGSFFSYKNRVWPRRALLLDPFALL